MSPILATELPAGLRPAIKPPLLLHLSLHHADLRRDSQHPAPAPITNFPMISPWGDPMSSQNIPIVQGSAHHSLPHSHHPPASQSSSFIHQPQLSCGKSILPPRFSCIWNSCGDFLPFLLCYLQFHHLSPTTKTFFDTGINPTVCLSAFLLSLTLLVIHSPLVSLISSNCYLYF